MKVRTHAGIGRGEEVDLQSVLDEVLPASLREESLFASDMDDTMFHGDSGQLIFLECLRQPSFYTHIDIQELESILLPNVEIGETYTALGYIQQGALGLIPGVSQSDCIQAIEKQKGLVDKFTEIRQSVLSGKQEVEEDIRIFIHEAISFDNLLISLNKQHPNQATSNRLATAFSRVRLFKGHSAEHLAQLATSLLKRTAADPDRHYILDPKAQSVLDRTVRINTSILNLLSGVKIEGMDGYVITGSPQPVAESLMRQTPYSTIVAPERIKGVQLKEGTQKRLTGCIEGQHIFGLHKRTILENIQKQHQKRVMLALGDFPSSDRHMGAVALENNGVFVITHKSGDEDRVRHAFDQSLQEIMGRRNLNQAADRIVYLPGQESFLHD